MMPEEEKMKEAAYERAKRALVSRCEVAGIKVGEEFARDGMLPGKRFCVYMPNGRETRQKVFYNAEAINEFLSIPFEKYRFLSDYAAIASYTDGTIEAEIRGEVASLSLFRLLKPKEMWFEKPNLYENWLVIKPDETSKLTVSVGPPSTDAKLLLPDYPRDIAATVKISGIEISREDHATSLLERITNSIFFEIDLASGLTLSLYRRRRVVSSSRRRHYGLTISFPQREFDAAPMSLYWYARNATRMPLLQYLAYYQVIEFYFPAYSGKEAGRKIQAVLRDPTFRMDREVDIGRLLSAISVSRGGSFGSEVEQLKATIQECVDPEDLRQFMFETEERKIFFSRKQPGLTEKQLSLNVPSKDLREEVADLIYDIRCKIVHTKGEARTQDGQFDMLLPFSRGADLVYDDMPLIEYVARKVLIWSSKPMTLNH